MDAALIAEANGMHPEQLRLKRAELQVAIEGGEGYDVDGDEEAEDVLRSSDDEAVLRASESDGVDDDVLEESDAVEAADADDEKVEASLLTMFAGEYDDDSGGQGEGDAGTEAPARVSGEASEDDLSLARERAEQAELLATWTDDMVLEGGSGSTT